jgi:signal transduction histidine kinase
VAGGVASPELSPRRARTGTVATRLPLLLAVVAFVAVIAELSLANAHVQLDGILTDAASGLAFSLAGLLAWQRRPGNRVGPLMTGIGLAWFGGDLLFAPVPLVGPLSVGAQAAARLLFAWLLLAFPSGRLESQLHRWAVGLIGALAFALAVLQLVTLDPATICDCPSSPFAFASGWPVASQLSDATAAVGMGMTVILVPLVVRRVLVASPAARRPLIPVLLGGLFSLLSVIPDLVARLTGTDPEPITWLPIVWVALPIGFLIALLDARMARGAVADLIIDLPSSPALEGHGTDSAGTGVVREPRRPERSTVLAIAVMGMAVGVALVTLAFGRSGVATPALWAFLACWVSLTYVAAGLVAWWRRPESRLGRLMIVAGFVTSCNFLWWSSNDVLATIGLAAQFLPPVLFLHVFLAFPDGRLRSRLDRAVVVAGYVTAAFTIPSLMLGIEGEPDVLAVAQAPEIGGLILQTQLVILVTLMLGGIAVLVWRRRTGPRPLRSALGRLVDGFALGLLTIAVLLTAGFFGWEQLMEPLRMATFAVIGLSPIVFLYGLLQARLVRASVGDLLLNLGANPGPVRLEEVAARALRDPSVSIVYWLEDLGEWTDARGRQIALVDEEGRSSTPVLRDGVTVAALRHDAALDDEPQLLMAVARAVGLAIENSQLQVELQARLADVRASRARIVEAGDAERRRLERDLHDGAQQRLVALSLALRRAQSSLPGGSDTSLASSLDDASQLVREALAELRELARGLHPAILTEAGLAGAVTSLAGRAPIPVEVLSVVDDRLPPDVEANAYFFISEALANVAKHAPGARATIRVTRNAGRVDIEVSDDGPGGAAPRAGSGLQGLEDRMAAIGGGLAVSSPPHRGTTLRGWIPIP